MGLNMGMVVLEPLIQLATTISRNGLYSLVWKFLSVDGFCPSTSSDLTTKKCDLGCNKVDTIQIWWLVDETLCFFFSFPKLVVSEAIHHPNVRVQAGKNGGWTTRTGWNRCNPWSCLKHFQFKNFIQFFGKFQQFGRTPRHVPIASDPLISLTILWQPRWIPPFF